MFPIQNLKHDQHLYRVQPQRLLLCIVQQLRRPCMLHLHLLNPHQRQHCRRVALTLTSGGSKFLTPRFRVLVNLRMDFSKNDYLHRGCTLHQLHMHPHLLKIAPPQCKLPKTTITSNNLCPQLGTLQSFTNGVVILHPTTTVLHSAQLPKSMVDIVTMRVVGL